MTAAAISSIGRHRQPSLLCVNSLYSPPFSFPVGRNVLHRFTVPVFVSMTLLAKSDVRICLTSCLVSGLSITGLSCPLETDADLDDGYSMSSSSECTPRRGSPSGAFPGHTLLRHSSTLWDKLSLRGSAVAGSEVAFRLGDSSYLGNKLTYRSDLLRIPWSGPPLPP
ncbi:hypothetical protein NEOLEDRAFT_1136286 [Neolentinus lepideus HHB14362 ss-1]|uniref:Uncharacterized protein n=1 Tax=Neolentinus lepideus HHB14362 ss-1 TaxID=1314782 RepID=A0A165RA08_9AGAM|nr:hypothetical protein NEOLEDRAFT_1136286 [Neolentinus lepideus HHB14362 ss-1]